MISPDFLEKLRRQHPRILVVGDVMLDGYWFGDAERISPEAPVPVVGVVREEYRPGGAASVASMLHALGAEVHLVGAVGTDFEGQVLQDRIREAGLSTEHLVSVDRPTVRKIRVIARQQQMLRLDWEDPSPLPYETFQVIRDRVRTLAPRVDGVVFQDYAKGIFTPERIPLFVEACNGRPVFVDPKPAHMDAYRNVSLIKPNRAEYLRWGRFPLTPAGLQEARTHLNTRLLLVTLGPDGMVLASTGGGAELPSTRHEVYDVTGAGDAVLAGMAFALTGGADPVEAALFATLLAGREVMHLGATPISWEEVEKEARDHLERLVQELRRLPDGP